MDPTKIIKQLNSKEKRTLVLLCMLALGALGCWLLFSPNGILAFFDVKKQVAAVKAENELLKEENRLLQLKIDRIKNDPAFLEELARREYDLLKKNEAVFEFK
ncbi:MAG: septum formation initiator family protein [Deltaproteobacteria bacterium]|nr:septum formation initiator family protein [Deltaproteobacteria bacterium]